MALRDPWPGMSGGGRYPGRAFLAPGFCRTLRTLALKNRTVNVPVSGKSRDSRKVCVREMTGYPETCKNFEYLQSSSITDLASPLIPLLSNGPLP